MTGKWVKWNLENELGIKNEKYNNSHNTIDDSLTIAFDFLNFIKKFEK